MISRTTKRFRKLLADLPPHVQRQARDAYGTWMRDPWHAGLQFKQIHATKPIYSARVGLDWRAVCVRTGDTALWYFIGSHADYDELVKTLWDAAEPRSSPRGQEIKVLRDGKFPFPPPVLRTGTPTWFLIGQSRTESREPSPENGVRLKKITGANAGGPCQLALRTRRAARVAPFGRLCSAKSPLWMMRSRSVKRLK